MMALPVGSCAKVLQDGCNERKGEAHLIRHMKQVERDAVLIEDSLHFIAVFPYASAEGY